jgi:hypothetical protein
VRGGYVIAANVLGLCEGRAIELQKFNYNTKFFTTKKIKKYDTIYFNANSPAAVGVFFAFTEKSSTFAP